MVFGKKKKEYEPEPVRAKKMNLPIGEDDELEEMEPRNQPDEQYTPTPTPPPAGEMVGPSREELQEELRKISAKLESIEQGKSEELKQEEEQIEQDQVERLSQEETEVINRALERDYAREQIVNAIEEKLFDSITLMKKLKLYKETQ